MEKSGTFSPFIGSAVKRTPTLSLSVIMRLLPFVFVSTLPTKPVPDWMPSEVRQKRYPNRPRARFKDDRAGVGVVPDLGDQVGELEPAANRDRVDRGIVHHDFRDSINDFMRNAHVSSLRG